MSSLLTVGSMAFDQVETPFGKRDKIVGGAATYICMAASYFVKNINLVSVIGGDFPTDVLDGLQNRGISLSGVEIKKNEKSFFWSGRYHSDMNTRDTLATELNVLGNFNPTLPEEYKNPNFLMLGNLSPTVQSAVIEQLRHRPSLIAMDTMNFWMETAMKDLKATLALIDLLIINDEEARQLSGEHSLVKAAKKINELGPKYLIIKKGENGALLFHEGQIFFAPALPLEDIVDPTGAGDTFAGGFMGYLARTGDICFENMKRAVIYGSAMASFCVEKFGIEKLLTLNETLIQKRITRFVELINFDTLEVNSEAR